MVDEAALQEVIFTTFLTSGTATLIAAAIGVPLGAWCARQTASFFSKLQTVITALYGLPPVVVGVFVYSLFSKSGMLGGLDLLFTVEAMIFAQTCLILPLVWGGSWAAFEAVGEDYSDTLRTLGVSPRQRLVLEVGLAKNGVYHAVILGFGRAIAEVGAVIMVGGNISGKTRVMTTSIVLETSKGNMDQAALLGLLLLGLSLALVAFASFARTQRRRKKPVLKGERVADATPYSGVTHHVISLTKNEHLLLEDVELQLKPGTIISIVGESGAGKSTLLRCLAGLEEDEVLCGPGACVFVPQRPVLLTPSVAEELHFSSHYFPALPPAALYYQAKFSLGHLNEHSTSNLSGGERQRVVLARQLSLAPSLLLLDECTANLGWKHIQAIEEELVRLKNEGVCIVMVTHNILQAKRLADEVIVLHEGKRLSDDDPLVKGVLSGSWMNQ
ncbi:MAG: ABC transporter permease [Poseidonia sp.]